MRIPAGCRRRCSTGNGASRFSAVLSAAVPPARLDVALRSEQPVHGHRPERVVPQPQRVAAGGPGRQRHWLARFRRRSIVVSKAKRMVDASIALFARFGGNDRIGELASVLA
jgi:hypothetical protein